MKINPCFECAKPATEMHHVIPRSKGGTKTVPLCHECHGLVHDMKRPMNHAELTKAGLEKAKERGVIGGRPKGYSLSDESRKKIAEGKKNSAKRPSDEAINIATRLRKSGSPFSEIAKELNALGSKTPNGGHFSAAQARKMINRWCEPTA